MEKKDVNHKRWNSVRKAKIALSILVGESSTQEVAQKHHLPESQVKKWVDIFYEGGENALRVRPRRLERDCQEVLLKKVCQENLVLKEKLAAYIEMVRTYDYRQSRTFCKAERKVCHGEWD